ncbi:MAG: hypothetical protein HYV42_00545 [Candidatus Magasanikbacteria bacterium]|nr:hypothetical protein [Candidatus Magasanikbacteria bacterium]
MPVNLNRQEANLGNIIFQWTVPEYERHQRSRRWFMVMITLGALLVVYGLLARNYLFALIIVLFGVILYLHQVQEPLQVPFAITETGIVIGRKFYRYSELKSFWVIYNPPQVKNLYFAPGNFIRHRLQIPLLDYDPRPVREYLSQFLAENLDEEEEPVSDRLGRVLKLH